MRSLPFCIIIAVPLLLVPACSDDGNGSGRDAAQDSDASTPTDATSDPDGTSEPDATLPHDGSTPDGGVPACPAAALSEALGAGDRLWVGGSMSDDAFGSAPFDVRYQYVSGAVPSGGPCASCATGCTVNGQLCDNNNGCEWWGCWQWDQEPPGRFVARFAQGARAAGAIPMITYYIWFSVAGYVEGAPEIAALTDGDRVADLLGDFRFLCEVLAEEPSGPAIIHLEPDLWGYGHQINDDPTQIPVSLSGAGDPACAGLGNHFADFARCLVRIARDVAPALRVALHASAWGAGHDALTVTDPSFDFQSHAEETAQYLTDLGATETDLVVVEMSDRDAGFNNRWWDPLNQTRPHFHQAIGWVSALGEALGLPTLWWQVPYGHMGLPNTCDRYEDNRVDYVFDHPEEFAAAGSLGVAFGAGATCMTTPNTDDGHFTTRAAAYFQGQRPPLCGP